MESRKKKNSKKKRSKLKIFFITILVFLLFAVSASAGYFATQYSKVKTTKISSKNEDLGISAAVAEKVAATPDAPINIALFGIDKRNTDGGDGNSDTIMIATIDKAHNKVKLSSIMRDSYVNIPGYGMNKINEAYALGGPQLAIKTINSNFNMDIKDFVTVDMYSMVKIIDYFGGLTIDVNKDEMAVMNKDYINVMSSELHVTPPFVKSAGVQLLNGIQAVSYSRVRYAGDGDYQRTLRQRTVLTMLLQKIQAGGVMKYPGVVNTLLPYTETSLSLPGIVSLGTNTLSAGVKTIDQVRFPLKSSSHDDTIKGVYYLVIDIKATADQIHKFIYDDVKPAE